MPTRRAFTIDKIPGAISGQVETLIILIEEQDYDHLGNTVGNSRTRTEVIDRKSARTSSIEDGAKKTVVVSDRQIMLFSVSSDDLKMDGTPYGDDCLSIKTEIEASLAG